LIPGDMAFRLPAGWRCVLARLLCSLLLLLVLAPAHAGPSEYEVKAAFIHNIAKFIEWPAAPRAPNALKFCVLGQNPFGAALVALQGKFIGGMAWEVAPAIPRNRLKECSVLFISASEYENLNWVLNDIKDSPVLTLGDTEGYAGRGVMVNFYLENGKIRFEINLESANRAGLKVSSKLIQIGKLISTPK